MILQWLQSKFAGTIYVRVYRDKINLKHIEKRKNLEIMATTTYSTKRLLVGDFVVAEKYLRDGIKELFKNSIIAPRPAILIQPMDNLDGGISPVEMRVLHELGLGAGGYKVRVWLGSELTDSEVIQRMQCIDDPYNKRLQEVGSQYARRL